MKLRPIGDRIIVKRQIAESKTGGGILLPEAAKKKPQSGTIVAVGPGRMQKDGTRTALQLKVGDTVLFTSWAGDEFRDRKNPDEVLVMHESDVLAVIG